MTEKWSIHSAMDARDIALVMDRRAVIDRKFADRDVFRELRSIAERFLFAYQGDFAWIADVKAKFHQYGKLFDSQVAGILNTMVRCVEDELKQTVRAEIHKQKKAARPGAMQQGQQKVSSTTHLSQSANAGAVQAQAEMIPDGLYRCISTTGQEYHICVRAGRVVLQGEKRKGGLKINVGARPVVGDLFSDEDMEGLV